MVAFSLRLAGIVSSGTDQYALRVRSFQCLSFVAPLIWYGFPTLYRHHCILNKYCSLQVEFVKARSLYLKLLLTPKSRGYPYLRRLEVCILHFSSLTTPDCIIVGSLVLCRFALRACYKNQEFSSVYVLISF